MTVLGAIAKDSEILNRSSSGGIFSLLAEETLKNGGAVFGCRMASDFKSAEHTCISDKNNLPAICGSKYLKSSLKNSFAEAKSLLAEKKPVLFSGTPCQISALLKSITEEEKQNLVTVDIICHGAPRAEIWAKYAEKREKDAGSRIKNVSFRNKDFSWREYGLLIEFENGSRFFEKAKNNRYLNAFVSNYFLLPSCYDCKNKGKDGHSADITLGDFWGVETELETKNGVSLVLLNTEKGEALFNSISKNAETFTVDFDKALLKNPSYNKPSPKNPLSSSFIKDAEKRDIDKVLEKYCSSSLFARLRRGIMRKIHR